MEGLHYTYNANRWLQSVQAVISGRETPVTIREYTYDAHGKVSEIKEYPDFADGGNTCITKSYAYDALGQFTKTEVTDHRDNDSKQTITYQYDKAGNRTKKIKGSAETSYTYNGLDQLLTVVTERGGAEESRSTYTYDVNGNQMQEVNTKVHTTTVNEYDADNRLSKATITSNGSGESGSSTTLTQENLYNGEGQRIQKTEGANETNYFYQDGVVSYTTEGSADTKAIQNLLGVEGNVIAAEENVPAANETANDSLKYYLYNKDIQGSTTSILNESGAGELSYEYDDFGETKINGSGAFGNEICYTGGIYDASTGLYYLNARYYDPENGRFLTEDTYRGELKEPDTLHLYAYCKNNPINYVDPSGHWVETALDVLSIGWSAAEFASKPSWITFGSLVWDVGAAFLPFVPGSYSVKAYKMTKKGKKVSKVSLKVASKIDDLKKGKKYLTIGKYKSLRKMFQGKGSKYQCHHIIETRLGHLALKADNYPSIPITKELHNTITNRWRKAIPYRGKKGYGNVTKKQLLKAVDEVYKDMPELKKVARKTVKKYYKK